MAGNTPGKNAEQVYWYQQASNDLQPALQDVARKAYLALDGCGYGRVDIRTPSMDDDSPFVLEVNANCGVSFNPNEFTSTMGEV
jgi:D-alanine-D-alanine ligase-like ATP-grasp enzyme